MRCVRNVKKQNGKIMKKNKEQKKEMSMENEINFERCFNEGVAMCYGVKIAVVLHYFYLWYRQNEANGIGYYNGEYWIRKSIKECKDFFPYISESQLRRILRDMTDQGLLKATQFNHYVADRTKSYTLTEKAKSYLRFFGYDEHLEQEQW